MDRCGALCVIRWRCHTQEEEGVEAAADDDDDDDDAPYVWLVLLAQATAALWLQQLTTISALCDDGAAQVRRVRVEIMGLVIRRTG
eukprot:COSAG01_NODE_14034_length_1504_cov_3.984342_2_plen_86_part_00